MANLQSQEPVSYTTDQAAEALIARGGSLFGDEEPAEGEETEAAEAEVIEEIESAEAESTDDETNTEVEPEESISLETLDDVAKALGVDPDDLMANLKMRIKVNGQEELISLSEAQKGNQLERDYRHKTAELAEQRRAIQSERETALAQLHQAAMENAAAMQWAEQSVLAELNTPAMAELRQVNPAEWLIRQQEVQGKLGTLHQARQQAQQQFAQAIQAQQAQQARYMQSYLQEQATHLKSKVPDWSDTKKSEVADFLKNRYGYNDQDVSGVTDHRLVMLAMDAMRGAQVQKESAKALQKVKAAPKLQAPGKPKSPINVRAGKIAQAKGQLKKSGHLRDAARVIETLFS